MCISKDQETEQKKNKTEHTSFGHSLIFFRQSGGRIHAGRGYWSKKRDSAFLQFAWTVNILIMVFGFWGPQKKSHLKSIYAGIKIQFSRATLFFLQLFEAHAHPHPHSLGTVHQPDSTKLRN